MHAHLIPEPTWHDLRTAHEAAAREDAERGRVEAEGQRELPWTMNAGENR